MTMAANQIAKIDEVRREEIRPAKVCPLKPCSAEARIAEVRLLEVRPVESRAGRKSRLRWLQRVLLKNATCTKRKSHRSRFDARSFSSGNLNSRRGSSIPRQASAQPAKPLQERLRWVL